MPFPNSTTDPTAPAPSSAARGVIDVDVHESTRALSDLLPYLENRWQRYIKDYGWVPNDNNPFGVPTVGGVNRADAAPDGGGSAGSDLALLQRQLLDAFPIRHAVLTGRGLLNPTTLAPGWPEFKTALVSAYNDWVIDNWLSKDDRFLGSIHVNAHDPVGAVHEILRLQDHPRIVQVMLYMGKEALGDPRYHATYEAAASAGLGPDRYGPTRLPYLPAPLLPRGHIVTATDTNRHALTASTYLPNRSTASAK